MTEPSGGTEIVAVRSRVIGFSRSPNLLRRNLVTNASAFEDSHDKPNGWFGPAFCTVVELRTRDGAVGVGTAGGFHGAAKSVVDDYLAELAIGQDVRDHEALWQRLYRATVRFGRRGVAVAAISAVDIAAWDAHGVTDDRTVYQLLGGRAQSRIPCYASRLYAYDDLEQLKDEARAYVAQGFTRMKQRFGFGPADGREGMRRNVELVGAVREAVGDDVELAADAYMGWDRNYALDMAHRLREFSLSWIEEPLMPDQRAAYRDLRDLAPWQRWSHGEHSYTKWDFQEIVEEHTSSYLQPDLNRAGGITEGRKIAVLSELSGVPLVPHSNEAHNLAVSFSQGPTVCPVIEYFPDVEPDTGNELFWRLFRGNPVADGGWLTSPKGPGLGVELDENVAQELLLQDGDWITA